MFLINKCYKSCIYILISKFSVCEYFKCTYLVIQPVYHKAISPLFKVIHGIRHRKDSQGWSLAKAVRSSLPEWMCMILNSQYWTTFVDCLYNILWYVLAYNHHLLKILNQMHKNMKYFELNNSICVYITTIYTKWIILIVSFDSIINLQYMESMLKILTFIWVLLFTSLQ